MSLFSINNLMRKYCFDHNTIFVDITETVLMNNKMPRALVSLKVKQQF